jgi:hypothetical protein
VKNFVILLSICLLGSFFVPSPGTGTVVGFPDQNNLCALSSAGCDAPMPAEKSEVAAGSATGKISCNEDNNQHNKQFRLAAARGHVAAAQTSTLVSAILTAVHPPAPGLSRLHRLNI